MRRGGRADAGDPVTGPSALVLATLDTKGPEAAYLAEAIRRAGVRPLVLDLSVFDPPTTVADIPREEVARAAGADPKTLRTLARAEALDVMAKGAALIARRLLDSGELHGRHGPRRVPGNRRRDARHGHAAVRPAEAHGVHDGVRQHAPLRGHRRHRHALSRGGPVRPEPLLSVRAGQRRPRDRRHGARSGNRAEPARHGGGGSDDDVRLNDSVRDARRHAPSGAWHRARDISRERCRRARARRMAAPTANSRPCST